jgi:regulator of protease activity HflC (stomatin/prohibitin superfamily)
MNKTIQERDVATLPGMLMVLLLLVFAAGAGWWVLASVKNLMNPLLPIVVLAFVLFLWGGFFIVQPNQAAVLQFFGKFVGVERHNGLRWANPLYSKKSVTLRVRAAMIAAAC